MELNQDDKAQQPVDNKTNQTIAPEVKKEETNSNLPTANQVRQPDIQEKKVQPIEPTGTDNKKISDTPDTKEPKEDEVKGKVVVSEPAEEKKG